MRDLNALEISTMMKHTNKLSSPPQSKERSSDREGFSKRWRFDRPLNDTDADADAVSE